MISNQLYSSTAIPRFSRVFDTTPNGFPPAIPGTANMSLAASITAAAKAAMETGNPTTKDDLMKRAPDSAAMLDYWTTVNDIVEGYGCVKAAQTKYLPKFPDESNDEYEARLNSGKFTNIYRDIVETLASKPFEEEVTLVTAKKEDNTDVELPEEINAFKENVDGAGNNLTAFAAVVFFNGINSAIDWIYVDYPKVDTTTIKTIEQLKAAKIKPFWSHVLAINVLEARSAIINGNEELIYLRMLEPGTPNHVRVFEKTSDGKVDFGLFQEVIGQDGKDKTFVLVDYGPITIGVIPLVPFATGRRDGRTFKYFPPMRDAADLQIKLYQQESALEWAKVMTAYPMLAANGIKPEMMPDGKTPKKVRVGPNRVLYSTPDGMGNSGHWEYVSPDAACLTFLAADVKTTSGDLRELGRIPLTAQSGNLTVITTAFAAGKARSAVGAMAIRLKDALENALVMTCLWLNIPSTTYDPEVNVYTDFDNYKDDTADLATLNTARAARDVSQRTYWHELGLRGVLSPEFNADEEEKRLLDETPDDTEVENDDPTKKPNPLKKPTK